MILHPPKCFWLALFTFTLISNDCVGQHQDSIIKRALVKSWRKKAEEYKVRLFDRLPTNEERSYTPPQVIKNRGYPVEIHQVTTDDGYVLELHRIPPNSSTTPKKVVFLQHGVLQNSGVWTANPTSRSLGNCSNVSLRFATTILQIIRFTKHLLNESMLTEWPVHHSISISRQIVRCMAGKLPWEHVFQETYNA